MSLAAILAAAALALQAPADAPDWAARAASYERLHAETGNAALLWLAAESRARAGDAAAAVAALERVAALRTGLVVTDEPGLAALRGQAEFDRVAARLDADAPPTGQARLAAEIALPGLIPEGIAAAGDRLFLGDMAGRRILEIAPGRPARLFATLDGLRPLGMAAAGGLLWVAATTAFVAGEAPRSAVLAFDLASGAPAGSYTSPELRSVNDLAVAPDGTIWVTDSLGGALFRLRPRDGALERVTPAGQMSYPNGVAVSADGGTVHVAQGVALRRIDTATGAVETVAQPPDLALVSVDGLYRHGGDLVAVQNRGGPGRVLRLRLSPDGRRIDRWEVLAARLPGFDIPTTGAIRDGRLYLIANSQLDRLRDDGSLADAATLRPVRILAIALDGPAGAPNR